MDSSGPFGISKKRILEIVGCGDRISEEPRSHQGRYWCIWGCNFFKTMSAAEALSR
jgi:hypothetical protein